MVPDLGWRPCKICGVKQSAHIGLDHAHAVRDDDHWCSRCDDLVVNGCGSLAACDDLEREEQWEREEDRAWEGW